MLDKIKVVLIGTTHPGNIGAAARAMKTMGLTNLVLVNPQAPVDEVAYARSSGATDVLDNALVVDTLDEAISDCTLILGTSSRERSLSWPIVDAREAGVKAVANTAEGYTAILFGQERIGLTNDELQRCHFHLFIPTNPDYASLNIASAVQVIAYEVRMASDQYSVLKHERGAALANDQQTQGLIQHFEKVLVATGFLDPAQPRLVMPKLVRLFHRAKLDVQELNILRGFLAAVEKARVEKASGHQSPNKE